MKGLKIIAALSFIMMFYPIVAVPGVWKEWTIAVLSAIIFILSMLLVYVFSQSEKQESDFFEDKETQKESEYKTERTNVSK